MIALDGTPKDVAVALAVVGLGIFGCYDAWRTWRGEEAKDVRMMRMQMGLRKYSGRRVYRSFRGAALTGAASGPAFILGGFGMLIDALAVGEDESADWMVWLAVPAAALIVVGGLYLMVYLFFGVPDWLRPPCQRGWEMKWNEDRPRLVRPDAMREHPKYRPPKPLTAWERGYRDEEATS